MIQRENRTHDDILGRSLYETHKKAFSCGINFLDNTIAGVSITFEIAVHDSPLKAAV